MKNYLLLLVVAGAMAVVVGGVVATVTPVYALECDPNSRSTTQCGHGSSCVRVEGSPDEGVCTNPSGTGTPPPEPISQGQRTFSSPTGSQSFASLVCSFTGFISGTILPPLAVLMALVVGFLFMTSGGEPARAMAARKTLLFTVAGVVLLLLAPGIVSLIASLFGTTLAASSACSSPITTGTIVAAFLGLVNWFSWLVAVTSVVMGLYAGFLYMTANNNPANIAKATKVFSYTIVGIAVSVVAFSIIALVKQFLS